MIRINKNNKLSTECNTQYASSLGDIKIDDEAMNKIIEEVHKRYKFDKEFYIGIIFEWEYDDDSKINEEKSSDEEDDGF